MKTAQLFDVGDFSADSSDFNYRFLCKNFSLCKNMCCRKNILGIFLLLAFTFPGYTQNESFPILTSASEKETWFDSIIGFENSGIVNGREYQVSFRGFQTHPFFENEATAASVEYNENTFKNIFILYDIYTDELVLQHKHSNGVAYIQLDKEKLGGFEAYKRRFKKINNSFCELLFERENFLLVAKRMKVKKVTGATVDYERSDRVYLIEDGQWMWLTGKKSFLRTLKSKPQRKRLSEFLRSNKIRINKITDAELRKVAEYIFQLKQTERPG